MAKTYRPLRPLELEILMLAHYQAGSEIIALIRQNHRRGDAPSEQQCRYALHCLVQEGLIDDLKGEHPGGDRRMIAYLITDMGKKALRRRLKSLRTELGL